MVVSATLLCPPLLCLPIALSTTTLSTSDCLWTDCCRISSGPGIHYRIYVESNSASSNSRWIPPPSLIASFTGSLETRICGRDTCREQYAECSEAAKAKWRLITNSRNTATDSVQWFCGPCYEHYRAKYTTHVRGTDGLSCNQCIFIDDTL